MSLASAAAAGRVPSRSTNDVTEPSVVTIQWINRKIDTSVREDRPLASLGNYLSKDQLSAIVQKLGKRCKYLQRTGKSTNCPVVVPPRKSTKAVKVAFIVQAVQNSSALVDQLREEVNGSTTRSGSGLTSSPGYGAATQSSGRKRPRQQQQATLNAAASTGAGSAAAAAAAARTTTANAPASTSVASGQNSTQSQASQQQRELQQQLNQMLAMYGLFPGGHPAESSSTSGGGGGGTLPLAVGGMPIATPQLNHPALAAMMATSGAANATGSGMLVPRPSPEDRMVSELMQMGGFRPGEENQVKEYIRLCQQKKNEERQSSNLSGGTNGTSDGINGNSPSSSAAGASTLTVTADEVVLFIISQREADENNGLEEARLEDEIRQASEAEREKNSKRKEMDFKERCASAKTIEQIQEVFPNSWILKGLSRQLSSKLLTQKRQGFIDLLKIELKSKKWYGSHVPAHFYRRLCDRLKKSSNSNDSFDWLDGESAKIEHKLMSLSEQTERGLPKIFVEACSSNGSGASSDSGTNWNDDDDDDVIVIE